VFGRESQSAANADIGNFDVSVKRRSLPCSGATCGNDIHAHKPSFTDKVSKTNNLPIYMNFEQGGKNALLTTEKHSSQSEWGYQVLPTLYSIYQKVHTNRTNFNLSFF
jgi:hypothetical protein